MVADASTSIMKQYWHVLREILNQLTESYVTPPKTAKVICTRDPRSGSDFVQEFQFFADWFLVFDIF